MTLSIFILVGAFFLANSVFAYQVKFVGQDFSDLIKYQLYVLPIFFVVNLLLGFGFKIAYKYLNNMTVVLAMSKGIEITALLVVSYLFFSELPTWKTFLGLGFIVSGLTLVKM
ncbi:hypothetical protein [Brevibacillus nitrificans]|uniref:hypothetical protein n=1 Tax=Brevibacillus nitrificans TaxID=651560 RepID=UPI00261CF611|nr:hypothetical protein [Brevibacillus nitrificans]